MACRRKTQTWGEVGWIFATNVPPISDLLLFFLNNNNRAMNFAVRDRLKVKMNKNRKLGNNAMTKGSKMDLNGKKWQKQNGLKV
jgi:hypothetical protein